ncbi:DUF2628 domain-containing protein [Phaeovibrio sulfidiphilus]|uniref:DUF2628 domain-containing protein n=1 Tax=Phaeovibrio sulfidiphilus TaxID=1220600 RepID=A0A8J6YV74_9PROT|nr:DUF2628 domain-containing protein [Phaeovibrio sulfidiphilus]MBE1237019.1 DUF2628 domain-containing protein [Phaeovibrio sulfidiphilus]
MSSSPDRETPPDNASAGGTGAPSGLPPGADQDPASAMPAGAASGPSSQPGPESGPEPDRDAGLSAFWRRRFALIDRAGGWDGQRLANPKALTSWELVRVQVNIWALLFGCLYYLFKGMWKKGLVFLPISLIIGNVSYFLGLPMFSAAFVAAVPCAVFANGDYYRFRRFGETMWPVVRVLDRVAVLLPSSLGAVFLTMALFTVLGIEQEYSCSSERVTEGLRDLLHEKWDVPRSGLSVENIRTVGEGFTPGSLACGALVRGVVPEAPMVTFYVLEKGEGFGDITISVVGR